MANRVRKRCSEFCASLQPRCFELRNDHGYFRLANIPPYVSFVNIFNSYRNEVNNHPGDLSPVTTPIILLATWIVPDAVSLIVTKSCYLCIPHQYFKEYSKFIQI